MEMSVLKPDTIQIFFELLQSLNLNAMDPELAVKSQRVASARADMAAYAQSLPPEDNTLEIHQSVQQKIRRTRTKKPVLNGKP